MTELLDEAKLHAIFRSRAAVEAFVVQASPEAAEAAARWLEQSSAVADLVVAPFVTRAKQVAPSVLSRVALARVRCGPAFDALHCLPAAWSELDTDATARVRRLIWDAAAAGSTMPQLGRWAWATPGVVKSLILDGATSHAGAAASAARALAILADGFSEDSAPHLAHGVIAAARTLVQHREPHVWIHAARGLGRLAHGSPTASVAVIQSTSSPHLGTRRRYLAAIGAVSPALGADDWIDSQIDGVLDERARREDPWRLASLVVAAPHLARDRPDTWQAICELAMREPTLELVWSLAQGLSMIARQSASGLGADEERVATTLLDKLAALALDQPGDLARRIEATVDLERVLGREPSYALAVDQFEAKLRADLAGRTLPAPPMPRVVLDAALANVDGADKSLALAAARSATRAHALHLPALVLGVEPPGADAQLAFVALADRLLKDRGDFGTRAMTVGALTDLVASYAPGEGFGHAAAETLAALAKSRWIVDLAARADAMGATDIAAILRSEAGAKQLRREVQRFRKPLEDLFHTCLAPYAASERDATVPPALAAWWVLCAGPGSALGPIERDADDGEQLAEAIARIEQALRAGGAAAVWGPEAIAAVESLCRGTMLAATFARLVSTLIAIEATPPSSTTVVLQHLDALGSTTRALLAIGRDLDEAFAPDARDLELATRARPPSDVPPTLVQQALPIHVADDAPWTRLSPILAAVVAPVGTRLVEQLAQVANRFVPQPGATFGPYTLVELLGRGGMGEVWRARRGRRLVALKLARMDVSDEERAGLAASLRAEAENLELLSFAKVVVLLDAGVIADVPFLATSLVRGRTMHEHLIANATIDPLGRHHPLVARIVRDMCIGLDNLHRHGIVHRDLKPTNVMLRMRGTDADRLPTLADDPLGDEIDEAVLIDFGIAHAFHAAGSRGATPGYAAPETLAQEPVGPAADIYSLGATIFHLLAGRPLTGDRDPTAAMLWHLQTDAVDDADVRAALAHLPSKLADTIAHACRREPDQRIALAQFRAAFA